MGGCTCIEIMAADGKRHFKGCPLRKENYEPPKLVQLRLEEKVAKAADKWWKVEEWLTKRKLYGVSGSELVAFIVLLGEEK